MLRPPSRRFAIVGVSEIEARTSPTTPFEDREQQAIDAGYEHN